MHHARAPTWINKGDAQSTSTLFLISQQPEALL